MNCALPAPHLTTEIAIDTCGIPGSGDYARDHHSRAVRSAGRDAVCDARQKRSSGADPWRPSAEACEIRRAAECGPLGGGGRYEYFCATSPFQSLLGRFTDLL